MAPAIPWLQRYGAAPVAMIDDIIVFSNAWGPIANGLALIFGPLLASVAAERWIDSDE